MKNILILIVLLGFCGQVHADYKNVSASSEIQQSLDQNASSFDSKFEKDTSVPLKQFIQTAEKTSQFQKAVHYFQDEKFQVAMFRPEKARESFMKNGLTNIHQSKKTMAASAEKDLPKYLQVRINVEAGLLGMTVEQYEATDLKDRPKYALLRMDPADSDGSYDNFGAAYGEDVFVFKKDRIRSRTTFALGDSLDKVFSVYGADSDFKGFKPKFWDSGLIPWQAREILSIEASPPFDEKDGDVAMQIMVGKEYDLAETQKYLTSIDPILGKYTREEVKGQYDNTKTVVSNGANYVEAQIFGELTVDDVESFEFTNEVPSKEFIKFLRSHNVKIIDVRDGRKAYEGDGE